MASSVVSVLFNAIGTGAITGALGAVKLAGLAAQSALSFGAGAASLGGRGFLSIVTGARAAGGAIAGMAAKGLEASKSLAAGIASVSTKIAALGVATGGVGIVGAIKGFQSDAKMTGIENTFTVARNGAAAGKKEIADAGAALKAMGINATELLPRLGAFEVAAKGTALEGDKARKVFLDVAESAQIMGASIEDQTEIARTLGSILGKGKPDTEDLREQIGDRIPGAFQAMAQSMGVTTQEFTKMIEAGTLVSEDFLPKFAAQLKKNVTGISGLVKSPTASFELLKSSIFNAFVTIGRNGGSKLIIQILEDITKAIDNLVDDGSLAAFTKSVTDSMSRGAKSIGNFAKSLANAFAYLRLVSSGKMIPSAIGDDSVAQSLGIKSVQRFNEIMGDGTARSIASAILRIRDYGRQIRQALVPGVMAARQELGRLATTAGQGLPGAIRTLSTTVIPALVSGFGALYRTLAAAGRYMRDFIKAFSDILWIDEFGNATNGLSFQLNYLMQQLSEMTGSTRRAFGIAPQDLAMGVLNGLLLINRGIEILRLKFAALKDFLSRFGAEADKNGTFRLIGQDIDALVGKLAGLTDVQKASPETIADAFDVAYRKIRDTIISTYDYITRKSSAFAAGYKFEGMARGALEADAATGNEIAQDKLKRNDIPDIAYPGEDQGAASLGQTTARFIGGFSQVLERMSKVGPILLSIAETVGPAFETALGFVRDMISAFADWVGSENFGKIAALILAMSLLSKIPGASVVGGLAGGIFSRLAGLVAVPAAAIAAVNYIGDNDRSKAMRGYAYDQFKEGNYMNAWSGLADATTSAIGSAIESPGRLLGNKLFGTNVQSSWNDGGMYDMKSEYGFSAKDYNAARDAHNKELETQRYAAEYARKQGGAAGKGDGQSYNINIEGVSKPLPVRGDPAAVASWVSAAQTEMAGQTRVF